MIALALPLALAAVSSIAQWRYVVPAEGTPLRRPPQSAVPLSLTAPEEVETKVAFTGDRQLWGMLRYGDPDSPRVAVVLDLHGLARATLYVDADRDLAIEPADRVGEPGRVWETALEVATRDVGEAYAPSALDAREAFDVARRVRFELGRTGTILGCATLGWLAGEVTLGEQTIAVRRRDGDANGLFADARDQLWLDLDADGAWAPLAELFLVQPILSLRGARYAVRSDRAGSQLALEALEGVGRVRLFAAGADGEPRSDLLEVQALLVGRDGCSVLARAPGAPTEVPVGEYRLGMLTLRVADPAGGRPWSFVFSESGRRGEARWHAVEQDGELALDPLGPLELRAGVLTTRAGFVPRDQGLTARPALYTGEGLLITTAYRGSQASGFGGLRAQLSLLDAGGRRLGSATSGFA